MPRAQDFFVNHDATKTEYWRAILTHLTTTVDVTPDFWKHHEQTAGRRKYATRFLDTTLAWTSTVVQRPTGTIEVVFQGIAPSIIPMYYVDVIVEAMGIAHRDISDILAATPGLSDNTDILDVTKKLSQEPAFYEIYGLTRYSHGTYQALEAAGINHIDAIANLACCDLDEIATTLQFLIERYSEGRKALAALIDDNEPVSSAISDDYLEIKNALEYISTELQPDISTAFETALTHHINEHLKNSNGA